eukprot:GHVP01070845.1.p1 GENE.GHVP01070845.1~~GHVP01070845.1.p1  ORF type:complete len:221 (+),score=29.09 GHVP01070845.1:2-664(+)
MLFGFYLLSSVQCVYIYLNGSLPRTFLEEVQKNTVIMCNVSTEEYNKERKLLIKNPDISLNATVIESKGEWPTREREIMNQKNVPDGRFFFTAGESATHKIVLRATHISGASLPRSTQVRVKLEIFFAPGTEEEKTSIIAPVEALMKRYFYDVQELGTMVRDIQKDQRRQQHTTYWFKNMFTKLTNKIIGLTLLQIVALGGVCLWQAWHLKSFFYQKNLM